MKRIVNIVLLMMVVALSGCFDKDIFPDTPNIGFEDIVFYDGATTDSLILTFSFEDGNGDIGVIESQDVLPPYNEFDVYIDSRDSVITEANIGLAVPPVYTAPLVTENFRPIGISGNTLIVDFAEGDYPILAFLKEFYSDDVNDIPLVCPGLTNQDLTFLSSTTLTPYIADESGTIVPSEAGSQVIASALPVNRIETHFNLILQFEKRVGDNYVPLNYQQIFGTDLCDIGVFNGRIPQYDPEGKSGTFTYSIQSAVLRLAFLDDVIRARFFVYDRAGNKSNEVTSPDFILADITQ